MQHNADLAPSAVLKLSSKALAGSCTADMQLTKVVTRTLKGGRDVQKPVLSIDDQQNSLFTILMLHKQKKGKTHFAFATLFSLAIWS